MAHINKSFKNFVNENSSKHSKKAVDEYKKTLNSEILTNAMNVAKILNLDLREGDIYTKSQFPEYTNFKEYKNKLESYIDDLDIYDIYYCYDTDEVLTSEPTEEENNGLSWSLIDREYIIKELFGEIASYL